MKPCRVGTIGAILLFELLMGGVAGETLAWLGELRGTPAP